MNLHRPDIGQSFAEIVEQLRAAHDIDTEYAPAPSFASGAAAQPVDEPAYVSQSTLSQIYEVTLEAYGAPIAPAPPHLVATPAAEPLPSTDPGDISRELNVAACSSVDQLLELRRRFALKNHPDRVGEAARDAATIRMGIANTLIDDAIGLVRSRAASA